MERIIKNDKFYFVIILIMPDLYAFNIKIITPKLMKFILLKLQHRVFRPRSHYQTKWSLELQKLIH